MQKAVSFSCRLKVSPESGISPAGCFSLPWRSKTRLCLVFINDYNLPLKTKFCQTQSWGIATTLMNCDGLVGLRQDAKAQSLSGWTLHDSSAVNLVGMPGSSLWVKTWRMQLKIDERKVQCFWSLSTRRSGVVYLASTVLLRGRKRSWRDDLREDNATLARRSKVYKACLRLKLKAWTSSANEATSKSHWWKGDGIHCIARIAFCGCNSWSLKVFYTLQCPGLECSTAWPCGLPEHQFTHCFRVILHHMVGFVVSPGDLKIQDHISLIWCLVPDLSCLRSHCCVLPLAPRGWSMSSITVWGSERLMSIEDCHGHMIRAWSLACSPIQHALRAHSMAPTNSILSSAVGSSHWIYTLETGPSST